MENKEVKCIKNALTGECFDIVDETARKGIEALTGVDAETLGKIKVLETVDKQTLADLSKNTNAIAKNTSDIAVNTSAIAKNTNAIAENTSAIDTNAETIAENASLIASNTSAIEKNKNDINTLKNKFFLNAIVTKPIYEKFIEVGATYSNWNSTMPFDVAIPLEWDGIDMEYKSPTIHIPKGSKIIIDPTWNGYNYNGYLCCSQQLCFTRSDGSWLSIETSANEAMSEKTIVTFSYSGGVFDPADFDNMSTIAQRYDGEWHFNLPVDTINLGDYEWTLNIRLLDDPHFNMGFLKLACPENTEISLQDLYNEIQALKAGN